MKRSSRCTRTFIGSLRNKGFWTTLLVLSARLIVEAATPPITLGAPCTLAWPPSPSGNVAGYAVYYGIEGPGPTNRLDTGALTSVTINSLFANTNYFFYAVAYDANGQESIPSPILSYKAQALSNLAIRLQTDGSTLITFSTAPGAICRVEYTSSLAVPQWQVLGAASADANGGVSFIDSLSTRPAMRFYRAVRLP